MGIRAARPADYRQLPDIERQAGERFRQVGLDDIADHDPFDADELAAAVMVFVATADDDPQEVVGYAMVELVDDHAHLEQLSVLPDHGGQGIGTQLLDAVADWARSQGHPEVTLTTFREVAFNAPLYAKRGYVVLPEDEWTDALRARVAHEATLGLDPSRRVVMRRDLLT
jgi:GNAT superfamily N-acetyltransferase